MLLRWYSIDKNSSTEAINPGKKIIILSSMKNTNIITKAIIKATIWFWVSDEVKIPIAR
jgi:hypothetical protein